MRLALVSAAGAALFAWPLLGLGSPGTAMAVAISAGGLLVLVALELMTRRLDARGVALLAAIAAIDSALRAALVTGIGGFSPMFFLILCAGYALGAEFGFLAGAASLLVSALVTAGVGPWLPYEMLAAGWVGALAGLVGRARRPWRPSWLDVALLAGVGVLTGFLYGAVMDVWDWTFFRGAPGVGFVPGLSGGALAARFATFYATTSAAYDAFRAAGSALMVVLLGRPVLSALARLRERSTLQIVEPGQPPLWISSTPSRWRGTP
ncbi:MAG: ECF transporter S component [Candidatus Dormibacteria bacterium]